MFAAKLRLSMGTITNTASRVLTIALVVLITPFAIAQDIDPRRLPWDIISETMDFDGKTSTMIYTGLRFSQGNISIEADEGRATRQEQENSAWQFAGNVTIDVGNGHIKCDSANLVFKGNVLSHATVTGELASFEMRRLDGDDTTTAEAKLLSYDVESGIIEFSGQASINEAGNHISAHSFLYDIANRRINADASETDEDRVRIIYTPTDAEIDALAEEAEAEVDAP